MKLENLGKANDLATQILELKSLIEKVNIATSISYCNSNGYPLISYEINNDNHLDMFKPMVDAFKQNTIMLIEAKIKIIEEQIKLL